MDRKQVLAEFICKIGREFGFLAYSSMWSSPVTGFSYDNSLPKKFMQQLSKGFSIPEGKDAVICVLADWESIAEGIVFTDRAMYVSSPKNKDKQFRVQYNEITDLTYWTDPPRLSIETRNNYFSVTTKTWSKRNIHDFLQFATRQYAFEDEHKERITAWELSKAQGASVGAIAAGLTYGSVSNASSLYLDDKLLTPRGHGFAAENANHLADRLRGRDAQIIGGDNAKNGADRLVDGVQIQSKYCATGSRCIKECFSDDGFRYWNPDGSPMQIEVPSDLYEDAVRAMENRIRRGEVRGVTDPKEARNIVRKGHFTYEQVKNIAKAGTVESLVYDAASGAVIAVGTFGITAVLSFATAVWNGEDINIAVRSAAAQGLKVGGVTFASAVLAGQLSKAGLNSALVGGSDAIVQAIGPKASQVLVNAFRSGTNIYGAAAMKSAAKMLRTNAITGAATFVVLSVGDIANIFRGRISGGQLVKNLANTASTVAGGGAGWVAGAAAGAAIGSAIPIIGTAVGGTVGGLLGAFGGGSLASQASDAVLDQFIEDDADQMIEIIQEVFAVLAEEYLTTQAGAEEIVVQLQSVLTGGLLKDMYASSDRDTFAREMLEPLFMEELQERPYIKLPSSQQMQYGLRLALEDIADQAAG